MSELSAGKGHKSSSCPWYGYSRQVSHPVSTSQLTSCLPLTSAEVERRPLAWETLGLVADNSGDSFLCIRICNCWNCPVTKGQDTHRGPHQHSAGVTPLLWKVRVKRIPILNSLSLCGPGGAALLTSDLQSTHQNEVSISESPSPRLGGGGRPETKSEPIYIPFPEGDEWLPLLEPGPSRGLFCLLGSFQEIGNALSIF